MHSNFLYNYSILFFIVFLSGCGETLFYSRQKSFSESPQYAAMREDQSYPAAILASDQNNDGFSDAWVLIEEEAGRHLELWLQTPLKKKNQEISYSKVCDFTPLKGGDLQNFTLTSLLSHAADQAFLLTAEDSPDEKTIYAQAAAYLPGHSTPCRLILQEKMLARAHLMSNEGRPVKALSKYREGYAIKEIKGQKVLIKTKEPLIFPFESPRGKLDVVTAVSEELYLPEKSGILKPAQKRNRDLATKEILTLEPLDGDSWLLSRPTDTPAAMLQIAWNFTAATGEQDENNLEFVLQAANESYHLPFKAPPWPAEIAAMARLKNKSRVAQNESKAEEPEKQYLYLLTRPLTEKSYTLSVEQNGQAVSTPKIRIKQVIFRTATK